MKNTRKSTAIFSAIFLVAISVAMITPVKAGSTSVNLPAGTKDTVHRIYNEGDSVFIQIRTENGDFVRFLILNAYFYNFWLANETEADEDEDWIYNNPGTEALDKVFIIPESGNYTFLFINENDNAISYTYELSNSEPVIPGFPVIIIISVMFLATVGILIKIKTKVTNEACPQ